MGSAGVEGRGGGDGGLGVEEIEVENGFDAGKGFAKGGLDHPAEGKIGRSVGDGVDAIVPTEEQGAKIVEPLGDDGEIAAVKDVAGADDGVEGPQAVVVEDHGRFGDAAREQGAFQFHGLVVGLVAAEDEALDFASAVQGRGGVDATDEVLVDAALFDEFTRGEDEAVAMGGQRADVGKDGGFGGGDDPDVGDEDEREEEDGAGERRDGGDVLETTTAAAHGLVHWRGMLTARRRFDKNSRCA